MKKFLVIFFILILALPCQAAKEPRLRNIFITDLSEVEKEQRDEVILAGDDYDINPDDVVLKGYAEFVEDSETIYMTDKNNKFVLNIKEPQEIKSKSLADIHKTNSQTTPYIYSKFSSLEYKIEPAGGNTVYNVGNGLSVGTSYDYGIDTAEFEQTTGVFTKYETKHFTLSSSYNRTICSTFGNYVDNIYVTPEIKLNDSVSVKEVLSTNPLTRRKKAEIVLSVKPFAAKLDGRLSIQAGVGNTYDEDNELIRSKFKFNTNFRF